MRAVSLPQLVLQPQLSAAVVAVKHTFSLSQIMIHNVTRAALIAFERLLDFSYLPHPRDGKRWLGMCTFVFLRISSYNLPQNTPLNSKHATVFPAQSQNAFTVLP